MSYDPQKTYRPRCGGEVLFLVHDRGFLEGVIRDDYGHYLSCRWCDETLRCVRVAASGMDQSRLDLIEVKPRIKLEKWLVASPLGGACLANSEADAKARASSWMYSERCAVKRIEIDCEEGEGL